jgi:chromosome partitioning protein
MTRIIAVANQKGGVGKTTTCVNLAAALADMRHSVLLVDLDPQANATVGCGINPRELEWSTLEVLLGECEASDAIVALESSSAHLLPATVDLTAAEVSLVDSEHREQTLATVLRPVAANYRYVIIDCPPSLNMLTLNALTAADSVLIPIQCEYYALEGLTALLNTIEQVQERINPQLKIEGLLRTMFDIRNNLSGEVSRQLTEYFGEKVYRTLVPRNVRLAEAPSHGLPVIRYDPSSRGAVAYLGLAGELIRRENTPRIKMGSQS